MTEISDAHYTDYHWDGHIYILYAMWFMHTYTYIQWNQLCIMDTLGPIISIMIMIYQCVLTFYRSVYMIKHHLGPYVTKCVVGCPCFQVSD